MPINVLVYQKVSLYFVGGFDEGKFLEYILKLCMCNDAVELLGICLGGINYDSDTEITPLEIFNGDYNVHHSPIHTNKSTYFVTIFTYIMFLLVSGIITYLINALGGEGGGIKYI